MSNLLALIVTQMMLGPAMAQDQQSVDLEVSRVGDQIEVQLLGRSGRTQRVSFTIDVTGNSRSQHSASTTLAANTPQVLSTIKLTASDNWCARVVVEEEGRAPYELSKGPCPNA